MSRLSEIGLPAKLKLPALNHQSGRCLVGMRGFEPPTPSSRTKCATRLRYIPNKLGIIAGKLRFGKQPV